MPRWNVTVRHSITKDAGSRLSNTITPPLKDAGLTKRKGSWVGSDLDSKKVAEGLSEMFKFLADPSLTPADGDTEITSLWLHIEPTE